MARTARIVLPGVPHHITQRGNQKQQVFFDDHDRAVYLALLRENATEHGIRIVAYCLMPNHVHIVGIPAREESLAKGIGRTHFRYTEHIHAKLKTQGHLWQNRFYSCPMDEPHTLNALAYVELNPVRAGLVCDAWDYTWSSAKAHCYSNAESTLLNLKRWRSHFTAVEWRESLRLAADDIAFANKVRVYTHKGRPLGDHVFQQRAEEIMRARKGGGRSD